MRTSLIAVALLALVGCAHEEDLRPAREPSYESPAPLPPPSYDPPPAGKPRLSQTVTLGQQEDYSPMPEPAQAGAPGSGVTVNNNITVNPPAYYGGYYGGYGYGGYGGGYGGYRGGDGRTGLGRGQSSSAWRGSGWEGAQRTAAPGHTPAVGGNWSPPPSSGPAQMK